MVTFYESDDALCDVVAQFLESGLAGGEPVVVIATEQHRRGVSERLAARGLDLSFAYAADRLVLLDAEETLSRFMVESMPDQLLFKNAIRPVLDRLRTGPASGSIRAYGEMEDLLWRRENPAAAIRLGEMWNDLQRERGFLFLCAHAMTTFQPSELLPADGQEAQVLASKTTSLSHPLGDVHTLTVEIAERKQTEHRLREYIAGRTLVDEMREAQLRRSERLNHVTAAIANAVTTEQVFDAVVDQVGGMIGAQSAALWLIRGTRSNLVRAQGYSESARRSVESMSLEQAGLTPVTDSIRAGEPVWINSREELFRQYPHLESVSAQGQSYRVACLPIVTRGQTLGALGFTFDDPRAVDDDEKDFLLLVARFSGQALERVRLLGAEQENRARAELLYGLAAAVNRAESAEEVFEAALDAIERALLTARSSILVFDESGKMRFRAWRGLSSTYRRAVDGHSPWSRETLGPQPILSADVTLDPAMAPYASLFRSEGIGAIGFFPLVATGRLVGKFMVYYDRPHAFGRQDLDLATAIAEHVAAAIARFAVAAELLRTVRFNEMFTGILAHDLRNPLSAAIFAARVASDRNQNERLVNPLSRILRSGERMTRMIDQLLDVTRIRLQGGMPVVPEPASLGLILQQVIDELQTTHPDWNIQLQGEKDVKGVWDADRLSQVFSNLVGNAIEHGSGERQLEIVIDSPSTEEVAVKVHNRGTIPAELLPEVFEPMMGKLRDLRKSRGLGLGLYITKEIVRAHGGGISVSSENANGTTFTVTLPREPVGATHGKPFGQQA
jgi:signal transduction histidine kinase